MKLLMFSGYDAAVRAYLPPFYVRSKGEALRSFTDVCNDGKSNFARHARDYKLFYMGEFDDATGLISSPPAPEFFVSAEQCIVLEGRDPEDVDLPLR